MTAPKPHSALFHRDFGELEAIFALVQDFLAANELDARHAFDLDLILEELFTNMVKYNRSSRDIAVQLRRLGNAVEVVLTDFDVEPYDITQAAVPDPQRPLADRAHGGLGLHLVRTLAADVKYEHREGRSIVTIIKELES